MDQPLGERLNEAESQQAQAEREVAAQFDAIRRELSLENDAMNTPLDEVRNMKHLIKAVTCRDWCDLRQSGAFFDWNGDDLTRALGKAKRDVPGVDNSRLKRLCAVDTRDLITFAQTTIDRIRPWGMLDEWFKIIDARVHPDMASVASAPDLPCELAWIQFEYANNKDRLNDDPVRGTVYVKLVNKKMLRFYMEIEIEPFWVEFNSHPTHESDSDSDSDHYDNWIFDINLNAGEQLVDLERRHRNALDDVPLYVRDILGEEPAPRWPCILLSMLVYTSHAMNPMPDRTSERIRTGDFRNVATILKPFFDIDKTPSEFIYPFFRSLIPSHFYTTLCMLDGKLFFYVSP